MRECSKISFPSGSHLKIARKVGDLNSSDSSVVCHAPSVAEEKPMQQLATFPFVKREFEDISSKYKRAPAEVKVGEALPRAANISTADYCTRKYETLLELENTYSVSGYLENIECGLVKPQILAKHRSILMDWMVDVVHSFRLNMETLFYSMRIVDQYMTHVTVKTSGLQLVAVAAMHVSCIKNPCHFASSLC